MRISVSNNLVQIVIACFTTWDTLVLKYNLSDIAAFVIVQTQ